MNAELTDTAALINEETQGSTRSDVEQLGSEICALAGQIAAATARFLTLLSKFDEDRGWAGPGLHSCAHWLSWKCGMSLHTGREYVRVAKALRSLPEMRKAFEQGRLSYSKVRALTRVTTPSNEKRIAYSVDRVMQPNFLAYAMAFNVATRWQESYLELSPILQTAIDLERQVDLGRQVGGEPSGADDPPPT